MKRKLLAALLGIAGSVACSYGQGSFYFSTYAVAATSTYGPVHWSSNPALAPAGLAGQPITGGSNIVADLVYSFNNGGLIVVDTGANTPLTPIAGYTGNYIDYGNPIILPGTYPNTSGAGPAISMTINLSGTYLGQQVTGTLTWTEPGFTAAPGQSFAAYPGTLTASVPEPASMALLGLGAASMLIFRKRK
jgi:hypothetical protein